jgi:hypothetical protein
MLARCPACQTKFRVPDPGDMMEETVVCWLDLDRLHVEEDRDELLNATGVQAALSSEQSHAGLAHEGEEGADEAGDIGDAEAPTQGDAPPPPITEQAAADLVSLADEIGPAEQQRHGNHGSFIAYDSVKKAADKSPQQPEAASPAAPETSAAVRNHRVPHLNIVDVGAYGVRLRFHVKMFDLPGFRASLPMRCIAGGEGKDLIARPLPWVDKATGHFVNPGELEARYEMNVRAHQSPREVLQVMSAINELSAPFNQPIPYYVSRERAKDVSIHCETFGTPDGVQCEVVIPSGPYALEWLGRVNGVCGEDYAQLEAEVLKFEAKAWRAIPQEVRHRLGVWFDFQAGEQFLGYFNDSDFAKSEAGLAGVVLTDHRVVYCKYHHHGSFDLADDILLAAIVDGQFADLKAKLPSGTRRMVRLRRSDAIALGNMLRKLNAKMQMSFFQPKPVPEEPTDAADDDESPDEQE